MDILEWKGTYSDLTASKYVVEFLYFTKLRIFKLNQVEGINYVCEEPMLLLQSYRCFLTSTIFSDFRVAYANSTVFLFCCCCITNCLPTKVSGLKGANIGKSRTKRKIFNFTMILIFVKIAFTCLLSEARTSRSDLRAVQCRSAFSVIC